MPGTTHLQMLANPVLLITAESFAEPDVKHIYRVFDSEDFQVLLEKLADLFQDTASVIFVEKVGCDFSATIGLNKLS